MGAGAEPTVRWGGALALLAALLTTGPLVRIGVTLLGAGAVCGAAILSAGCDGVIMAWSSVVGAFATLDPAGVGVKERGSLMVFGSAAAPRAAASMLLPCDPPAVKRSERVSLPRIALPAAADSSC